MREKNCDFWENINYLIKLYGAEYYVVLLHAAYFQTMQNIAMKDFNTDFINAIKSCNFSVRSSFPNYNFNIFSKWSKEYNVDFSAARMLNENIWIVQL